MQIRQAIAASAWQRKQATPQQLRPEPDRGDVVPVERPEAQDDALDPALSGGLTHLLFETAQPVDGELQLDGSTSGERLLLE